jgi:tRNA 2-thiouridine synthesizing protein D
MSLCWFFHRGKFSVKCLVIVNESPWQTGLSACALRFARAAPNAGMDVLAVFFREDGVYNAMPGTVTDMGAPELAEAWKDLAARQASRLLLCSASSLRRLPAGGHDPAFEITGLADMLELTQQADRVVTF